MEMETKPHHDLDSWLLMYEKSWDTETDNFLNHLDSKKREMEKIVSLEREVEERRLNIENLDEQRRLDYNKLERIYHCLKAREALYDMHLKCTLLYEQPNVYRISFLNEDSSVRGWIRFKYDQTKNNWIVLEIQPSNIVPDAVFTKFNELQDTQGFICFFRRALFDASS